MIAFTDELSLAQSLMATCDDVHRRTETVVTFQVDMRRPERLGMIDRSLGFGFSRQAYLEIIGGTNAGSYEMQDFEQDSIWKRQMNQLHRACAVL